jgi:hypothetical protein
MRQPLAELLSSARRLSDISLGWFIIIVAAEIASFACVWALTKLMLPELPWFVAATSQLASNSVSRVVPGGAAFGGALQYRMLSVSGVAAAEAASAMVASTVVSYALLLGIPAVAGMAVVAGAPVPAGYELAVFTGGALFAGLMVAAVPVVAYTSPLRIIGRTTSRAVLLAGRLVGRSWSFDPEVLATERARLIEVLGPRWPQAVAAAFGNWAFDFLALLAGLYAIGAAPQVTTVLLAFAAASVLAMIPLTPGGVGFVEVGLYSALIVSGIGAGDAAVATVAYRVVSWWLPVVAGGPAWLAFRARYRTTAPAAGATPTPTTGRTPRPTPTPQGATRTRPDGPAGDRLLPSPSYTRILQSTGKGPAT